MTPDSAARLVRERLIETELLRDKASACVRPILNWGGFVNWSFAASDRHSAHHVKLVDNPESMAQLRRWQSHAATLTARYNAPAVRRWIQVPDTQFAGLVLEWIEGVTPSSLSGDVRRQAIEITRSLHADSELAEALGRPAAPARSFRDVFASTLGDRFVEDLAAIRATPPSFVDESTLAWMIHEATQVAEMVETMDAFDDSATCATHGDLWLNNLMVEPTGRLRVIDWDDLDLGDPVLDWATLFGPSRNSLSPARLAPHELPGLSGAERLRLEAYARATMLDWVIDPLADWIEAERDPTHKLQVRAANKDVHMTALARYRSLYA